MDGKFLGKIISAEFGFVHDCKWLMGLQLSFRFGNTHHISDGLIHTVNISSDCRWNSENERQATIEKHIDELCDILHEAKVDYVSQLVGKPVEITIENSTFKGFRILTEVL